MNSYIHKFHQNIINPPYSLRLIGDNREYDQKEILEIIKKIVIYLDSLNIKENSRVAIISKNHPYFLLMLYALFYLRAIPVSIDYYHNKIILKKLIQDEPFLITDLKIARYKGNLLYLPSILKKISNSESIDDNTFLKIINKNNFRKRKLNSPFIILCSSGTTGVPKKVILSEKNIFWADKEYSRLYNFKKNDSIAYIVPTHYSLGILASGIIPFSYKKTIFISDGKKIKNCLNKISKYKINILPATPVIYNLMSRQNLNKYDFSCLKVCDSGGQILPISIIEKFAKNAGVVITEGYGLTETSSLTHFLVPDRFGKLRLGSMGKPCNGVNCKIVDKNGRGLDAFELGELLVKGPQNMLAYDNKKNEKIFTNKGWLRTGDIVYKDKDNFYYFISRKIDLLGYDFSSVKKLRDIEECLYSLSIIKECAILFLKNKKIIILVKPVNNNLSSHKIKREITDSLSKISFDGYVKLVNFIPRTSTHKIKRNVLRKKYKIN